MFTDLRIPAGRRPLTASEARISAIIGLVITLLFLAAIFEEYSPKKLSIVFYILLWVPTLVLHELGHALAAKALGWQVHEIVIGFGRTLWKGRIGETRVRIKLAPLEGYVLPVPTGAGRMRLKSAIIYAAGPGAEFVLLGILLAVFGWDTVFNDSDELGLIALKTLAVVIIIGGGFNLLPFRTEGAVSDGLGILSSPFMSGEVIETRLLLAELREIQELLFAGRTGEALELLRSLIARFPDNLTLQLAHTIAQSQHGRVDEARDFIRERLADQTRPEAARQEWLRLQAMVELNAPDPQYLVLDLAVQEGLRKSPDAVEFLAIKGASLVLRGDYESGGNLLAHAWRKGEHQGNDPLMLAYLAIAAHKIGDAIARDRFQQAFELTNRSVALERRVSELTGQP